MYLRGAQRRSIPWWRCDTSNRSHIPQHDSHAAETDHAEKVLDVIFVARDQSPEPLHMLGHHYISENNKTISTPYQLKYAEKQASISRIGQERKQLVATSCDEVQVSRAAVAVVTVGHRPMSNTKKRALSVTG
jgi:hypothetical protein